jgi:FkbM family methyltransferase
MRFSEIKTLLKKAKIAFCANGLFYLIQKIFVYIKERYFPSYPKEYLLAFTALKNKHRSGILFDIGASTGISLAPFATSGWKIHAFEPDIRNREVLMKVYGDFKNVTVDPRAVVEKALGSVRFYTSDESLGISSLSSFHDSHYESYLVDTVSLRDYMYENKLIDIDLLKMDTEGHDLFVLKGFPWEHSQPRMVICEFEDSKTLPLGYDWKDIVNFLLKFDYQLIISEYYPINNYGGEHKWRRFFDFPGELSDPNAWGNILATKDINLLKKLKSECLKFQN